MIYFAAVFDLKTTIRTPGYVAVDESMILFVPGSMNLLGVAQYVGYQLDGQDGELGNPVFLHAKMQIRQLGTLEEYLQDEFVQACLPRVTQYFRPEQGALPLIAAIECLRQDPDIDLANLAKAILERRNALLAKARQS